MSALRPPSRAWRAGAHAAVYLAAATMAFPFLWMVATSLKTREEAVRSVSWGTLLPESPQWGNYADAVRQGELGRFYANTIIVAMATTALAVAHNVLAGYAFAKLRFASRRPLFWMLLATMMLPAQVFFIFAYIIADAAGYTDSLRGLIVPFLASGFGIFYMRQAMAAVPDSLLDAGRIDGMRELDLVWVVARPIVAPGIAALAIFTFMNAWNNFFWPLIITDSERVKTLPLAVADLAAGKYVQSWPVMMAAGTILVIPIILVFFVAQRAFVRGVAATGIKE